MEDMFGFNQSTPERLKSPHSSHSAIRKHIRLNFELAVSDSIFRRTLLGYYAEGNTSILTAGKKFEYENMNIIIRAIN